MTNNKNSHLVPVAIIVAGLLIAGAIFYSYQSPKNSGDKKETSKKEIQNQLGSAVKAIENIEPINSDDHIRGNPEAPIKLVVFSDTECPFCKNFHQTMNEIMKEYGKDGRLSWVYRHFPLVQIHPKAFKEAEALECANELGNNDKFWEYLDKIFAITPGNNNLNPDLLPQIAQDIGLERQKFEECLESGKYEERVKEDTQDAIESGARGTPYSIVIAKNGEKFEINGAQPYSAVKSIIDSALK